MSVFCGLWPDCACQTDCERHQADAPSGGYQMAAMSNAVRRTGRTVCDLCGHKGHERNPLTRHHIDGNIKNNAPENHMVLHRVLCHTFSDYITQYLKSKGDIPTEAKIRFGWELLMVNDWLLKLLPKEV